MTRAELFELHPPVLPRTLDDLDDTDELRVTTVSFGAEGHRSYDGTTSVCGAPIGDWSVDANQLTRLCGHLCPRCWNPQANETPAHPGR